MDLKLIATNEKFPQGKVNINVYTVMKVKEGEGIWYPKREYEVALFRLGVRKGLQSCDVYAENKDMVFPVQRVRSISCFENCLTSSVHMA